jgi:DNA replicative helicase MCM subunit Mcm2 (Cdc46/Mcm family)
MIRLATAHAKLRLSKAVSREDAEAALSLMSRVLKGTEWQPDTSADRRGGGDDDDEGTNDGGRRERRPSAGNRRRTGQRESGPRSEHEGAPKRTRSEHGGYDASHGQSQREPVQEVRREDIDDAQRTRFRDALSHQFKFTDSLTVRTPAF